MSMLTELHPDDLLDKEAREVLTADERTLLDEHLRVCEVCRFERDVRDDFRAEFEELARRDSRASVPRKRVPRLRLFALVAAAVLVAGAAAAEWPTVWRYATETPAAPVAPASVTPAVSATHAPAPTGGNVEVGGAIPGDTAASVAAAEAPSFEPPPSAPTTEAANTEPRKPAPVLATSSATATASASASPSAEEPPTASALFARAGDARQHGAYADAIRFYEELTRTYPQSNEALNAHAFLGRLLLDRGDASGALAHFDAYLRGGAGALREDAMAGRAIALGQLGRAQDEAAAWNALLTAYPQSVHAARARARLSALESR